MIVLTYVGTYIITLVTRMILSILNSLNLSISWFRFYFLNLIIYKVWYHLNFKWHDSLYIIRSIIFNLNYEMDRMRRFWNGEISFWKEGHLYLMCTCTQIELSVASQPNKNQLGCFNYSKANYNNSKNKSNYVDGTEFGYKPVCNQLTITHYVSSNKIIRVYFSHMTYLMSYVIFLNNICG